MLAAVVASGLTYANEQNPHSRLLLVSKFSFEYTNFLEAFPEVEPKDMVLFTSYRFPIEDAKKYASYFREIRRFSPTDFSKTMFEIACIDLYATFQYSRIIIFDEGDLVFAATLRSYFNLYGQTVNSALAYRDKLLMKRYVAEAGISVPTHCEVSSVAATLRFAHEHGYPFVFKPIDGAGSVDTHVFKDEADLRRVLTERDYFNHSHPNNFMVEKFINGDMYHIDGIVYNGEIIVVHPSGYTNTCLEFMNGKPLGDYMLTVQNPLFVRLNEFSRKVIRSLPSPDSFVFHLEVFHTLADEIVFCEIASRVGGADINLTWKECLGINLRKEFFRLQAGLRPTIDPLSIVQNKTFMSLMIPPKIGTIVRIAPPNFEWVDSYEVSAKVGETRHGAAKSTDFLVKFLFSGTSEEELHRKEKELTEWADNEIQWEISQ